MTRRLAALSVALGVLACTPPEDAGPPRSTLVIGLDVSGSFRRTPEFDQAIDFAALYIYAHLHGVGGLKQNTAIFVGELGGERPGQAKVFHPIQDLTGKTPQQIASDLRAWFPDTDPITDFNAFFNRKSPPSPEAALPVVTFADSVTFHWNGDEIRVYHAPPAHTDGDSLVYFVKADVVHMGDLFFKGNYPFVDVSSGGKVDGVIAAADRVLSAISDKTKIIPGHGPLVTKADLQAYRDTVKTVRDRVAKLKAEGKTKEQAIAARPTADLDEQWGKGFIKGDAIVGFTYDTLP